MSEAPIAWQWGDVDASEHGERTCLTHRHTAARLWVSAGRLTGGAGYAGADAAVRQQLARVGAIIRLRERGRYLVHAAGVVDPQGRAWLFAGDSGSGKSTLAYALARTGWRVLGDDGVLVERASHGLIAHAWRDPLRVSRQLADAFPEILGAALRPEPGDARNRVPVGVPAAPSTPVAALVMIERAATFSLQRAAPLNALSALIRQSPWVILGDACARAHLDFLRYAASQRVFELHHTRAELHSLSAALLEALS